MSTTAQTYYSEARNELVMRIRLREQVLNYFLVAVGAILSIAIANINGVGGTVALVIPFLGLGTAILITSHTMVITSIAKYSWHLEPAIDKCHAENLKMLLRENKEPDEDITSEPFKEKLDEFIKDTKLTPWDRSGAFTDRGLWSSWQRLLGNIVVIVGPAIFAIYLGWVYSDTLELQRSQIEGKYSNEVILGEIRSTGNSDEKLLSILNKQSRGKETLDQVDARMKVHRILFDTGLILTVLIVIVLGYGHSDRKKWIAELEKETKMKEEMDRLTSQSS